MTIHDGSDIKLKVKILFAHNVYNRQIEADIFEECYKNNMLVRDSLEV